MHIFVCVCECRYEANMPNLNDCSTLGAEYMGVCSAIISISWFCSRICNTELKIKVG